MAHPLKKYARHLQDEIAKDPTLARASYSWCLNQAIKHLPSPRPRDVSTDELQRRLVEAAKKEARRAG